ncbi:MAG: hypothetical protein JWL58_7274 [Streptosporangiaceae bacterium]|nr:hypothetical protein [Streptosporangiaceae bacterium]
MIREPYGVHIRGNYSLAGVIKQLESISQAAEDLSAEVDRPQGKWRFLNWADAAERQLRRYLVDPSWADGFITPRYMHLHQDRDGLGKDWATFNVLLRAEIDFQHERMIGLMAAMKELSGIAQRPGEIAVLDTNAYLHATPFEQVEWCKELQRKPVRIVLPVEVLSELDKVKYMKGDRSDRADKVLKVLDGYPDLFEQKAAVVRQNVTIEVFAFEDGHRRAENMDEEIIGRALLLQQAADRPVTVVTDDRSMRVRAGVRGLQVWPIPDHLLLRKRVTAQ